MTLDLKLSRSLKIFSDRHRRAHYLLCKRPGGAAALRALFIYVTVKSCVGAEAIRRH
jgi:hypothetical protein